MYVLRRLLLLPLSLFLLSLVIFGLRQLTPGDPVQQQLPAADARMNTTDPAAYDAIYRRAAAAYGYDRPAFYLSLRNAALPDTLHRIVRASDRALVRALTLASGNWPGVQAFYRRVRSVAFGGHCSGAPCPAATQAAARRLLLQDDPREIADLLAAPALAGSPLAQAHQAIQRSGHRGRLLLPALRWYGTDNQYHRWLTRLLGGDLGRSYRDGRPVAAKITPALRWTALLNALAFLVIFGVSIPLGLYSARRAGSGTDHLINLLLFLLFGIPSFWVATLLTNFFTTPAYGMDFFPSMGFGEVGADAGAWEVLRVRASHLFLPVLCLAYPGFAYVTRHLRRSARHELGQAYVKTARLKGLSLRRIAWRHVLRNAAFPLITLFGGLLPALLAGSVLIERIFNLPGMGQLLFTSAIAQDWPVVIALVLLNGVLTALGLLLADLGYALADPRVRLGGAKASAG